MLISSAHFADPVSSILIPGLDFAQSKGLKKHWIPDRQHCKLSGEEMCFSPSAEVIPIQCKTLIGRDIWGGGGSHSQLCWVESE
jgi:hypothetical protein